MSVIIENTKNLSSSQIPNLIVNKIPGVFIGRQTPAYVDIRRSGAAVRLIFRGGRIEIKGKGYVFFLFLFMLVFAIPFIVISGIIAELTGVNLWILLTPIGLGLGMMVYFLSFRKKTVRQSELINEISNVLQSSE